jgi:hypothetical protein
MGERKRFEGDFSRLEDVTGDSGFGLAAKDRALPGCEILYAYYEYENWSGSAWVLYRDADGQLHEVHGSHCSCNGLEEQWTPEATTVEELRYRFKNGTDCGFGNAPRASIEALLAELELKCR